MFGKLYQAYRWMTSVGFKSVANRPVRYKVDLLDCYCHTIFNQDLIGAAKSGDVQAVSDMLEHSKDVKTLIQFREPDKVAPV